MCTDRLFELFRSDSFALLRAYKTYVEPALESGTQAFNKFKKKVLPFWKASTIASLVLK